MGKGEGKGDGSGEGKGGCGLFDAVIDAAYQAICCICCLIFIGPIFLLVALLLFISAIQNPRASAIDDFNSAVTTWEGGCPSCASSFTNQSFTATLQCTSQNINLREDSSGGFDSFGDEASEVGSYQRVVYTGTATTAGTATATCSSFDVVISNGNQDVGTIAVPNLERTQELTSFQLAGCTSNPRRQNEIRNCQRACQNRGGTSTGFGASFVCKISEVVTEVCIKVIASSDGRFTPDNGSPAAGTGCYYDSSTRSFEGALFESGSGTPSSLPVFVRSSSDPYLVFLEITDGTRSFGLSQSELFIGAGVTLVLGLVFTGCCCCTFFYLYKFLFNKQKDEQPAPQGGVGGFYYGIAQNIGGKFGLPDGPNPPAGYPVGGQQGYNSSNPPQYQMYDQSSKPPQYQQYDQSSNPPQYQQYDQSSAPPGSLPGSAYQPPSQQAPHGYNSQYNDQPAIGYPSSAYQPPAQQTQLPYGNSNYSGQQQGGYPTL